MYNTPFETLLLDVSFIICPTSLGYLISSICSFLSSNVNALFNDYIICHYPNSCLVFTNWSASKTSIGYSSFILSLSIKFSNNVPLSASSFTTKCLAILEALLIIKSLDNRNFVICSNSQSCLMALNSSPFASLSPVLVIILTCFGSLVILVFQATKSRTFSPSHVLILFLSN